MRFCPFNMLVLNWRALDANGSIGEGISEAGKSEPNEEEQIGGLAGGQAANSMHIRNAWSACRALLTAVFSSGPLSAVNSSRSRSMSARSAWLMRIGRRERSVSKRAAKYSFRHFDNW